jgi:hypothetical protein
LNIETEVRLAEFPGEALILTAQFGATSQKVPLNEMG